MTHSPASACSAPITPSPRRRAVLTQLMACVALSAGVSACTGGGGDAGEPLSPSPSPGGASGYIYSSATSATTAEAALAQYNTQGAAGSAYVGTQITTDGGLGNASVDLFVKPAGSSARFVYSVAPLDASTRTPESFVGLLDAQGSNGYAYKGAQIFSGSGSTSYAFFVKNQSKAATYRYAAMPVSTDPTAVLQSLNTMGSQGYAYLGDIIPDTSNFNTRRHLFQQDSTASGVTYTYTLTPLLDNRDSLLTEVNAQGQNGTVWRGGYVVGAASKSLYERASNTAQAVSFTFETDGGATGSAFINQLNAVAAQGYFYAGPYQAGNSGILIFQKGAITPLPLMGTVLP